MSEWYYGNRLYKFHIAGSIPDCYVHVVYVQNGKGNKSEYRCYQRITERNKELKKFSDLEKILK